MATMTSREVETLVTGKNITDGGGVRLLRVLTPDLQRRLDPFLMLDEFRSDDPNDYLAGFPDHPHRGFETVTYMLAGAMRHRDNAGHSGRLVAGGVQWMTAGRGIVHSEMPEQVEGLLHGFQLWINLPAARKMERPGYQELQPELIPEFNSPDGARVRVIAGAAHQVVGPIVCPDTDPLYLDLFLAAGSAFSQPIDCAKNAFLYVYQGEVAVGANRVAVGERKMAILGAGSEVSIAAESPARLLLIAGKPLNEPISQLGPFVMNTREQVEQALIDYRDGKF